jgi:hypothetical protein
MKKSKKRYFNFKDPENWGLVKPYLNDREVKKALRKGMKKLIEDHLGKGKAKKFLKEAPYAIPYLLLKDNPKLIFPATLDQEDIKRFEAHPSVESLDYYRPYLCCHYIAGFVKVLAEKIFPNDSWRILKSRLHSIVINSNDTIIMDILRSEDETPEFSYVRATKD